MHDDKSEVWQGTLALMVLKTLRDDGAAPRLRRGAAHRADQRRPPQRQLRDHLPRPAQARAGRLRSRPTGACPRTTAAPSTTASRAPAANRSSRKRATGSGRPRSWRGSWRRKKDIRHENDSAPRSLRLLGTFADVAPRARARRRAGEPPPDAHRRQHPRRHAARRGAAAGAGEARRHRGGQGAAPRSRAASRRSATSRQDLRFAARAAAEGARLQRDRDRHDRAGGRRQRGDLHACSTPRRCRRCRCRTAIASPPSRSTSRAPGRRSVSRLAAACSRIPEYQMRPRPGARIRRGARVLRRVQHRSTLGRRRAASGAGDARVLQLLRRAAGPHRRSAAPCSRADCAAGAAPRRRSLSHALWRQAFSADPAVVGRTIMLNRRPFAGRRRRRGELHRNPARRRGRVRPA